LKANGVGVTGSDKALIDIGARSVGSGTNQELISNKANLASASTAVNSTIGTDGIGIIATKNGALIHIDTTSEDSIASQGGISGPAWIATAFTHIGKGSSSGADGIRIRVASDSATKDAALVDIYATCEYATSSYSSSASVTCSTSAKVGVREGAVRASSVRIGARMSRALIYVHAASEGGRASDRDGGRDRGSNGNSPTSVAGASARIVTIPFSAGRIRIAKKGSALVDISATQEWGASG